MIIESVAAASAILTSINGLIKQANETGAGMQQLMGTISDFGEALTNFEIDRKSSTFKPLSQSEILKLTMLKKSYERSCLGNNMIKYNEDGTHYGSSLENAYTTDGLRKSLRPYELETDQLNIIRNLAVGS